MLVVKIEFVIKNYHKINPNMHICVNNFGILPKQSENYINCVCPIRPTYDESKYCKM